MAPSSTVHRPQALIGAGFGLGQMLSCLTMFAMTLGLPGKAGAASRPPPRPDPPARQRGKEAWHSYAVYSGALSLRHYKSSRRHP
jgi:hypothetical protein